MCGCRGEPPRLLEGHEVVQLLWGPLGRQNTVLWIPHLGSTWER